MAGDKRTVNAGVALAMGAALGIAIGVAMDNIGLGIAIGMGLAIAFGYGQRKAGTTDRRPDRGGEASVAATSDTGRRPDADANGASDGGSDGGGGD